MGLLPEIRLEPGHECRLRSPRSRPISVKGVHTLWPGLYQNKFFTNTPLRREEDSKRGSRATDSNTCDERPGAPSEGQSWASSSKSPCLFELLRLSHSPFLACSPPDLTTDSFSPGTGLDPKVTLIYFDIIKFINQLLKHFKHYICTFYFLFYTLK